MNWDPFILLEGGKKPPPPRDIRTTEGVCDRLRAVAFAEWQAERAFLWASETFLDAPQELILKWKYLALEERKHRDWLLHRFNELRGILTDRPVSLHLLTSLLECRSAKEFSSFMANAEKRGQAAGERLERELKEIDPISAQLFGKIAREEVEHVQMATSFFGEEILKKH